MAGLLILGAGGHGKVVAEIALMSKEWDQIAFLDDREDLEEVEGVKVSGRLEDHDSLLKEYQYAFVALGNNKLRLQWIDKLSQAGFLIPTMVHPYSFVSMNSTLGEGTVVMAGAVINICSTVGKGCIINTSSSIDHDCVLEDGVHVSPGSNIGGTVSIGKCTWVCLGSAIANNVSIGSNVVVAAGAAIVKDVTDNVMVGGIPGTIIKKVQGD